MSQQVILLLHPTFGVFGILAALWVFVDALRVSEGTVWHGCDSPARWQRSCSS